MSCDIYDIDFYQNNYQAQNIKNYLQQFNLYSFVYLKQCYGFKRFSSFLYVLAIISINKSRIAYWKLDMSMYSLSLTRIRTSTSCQLTSVLPLYYQGYCLVLFQFTNITKIYNVVIKLLS